LIDVETFAWLERILVLCFYIASADIDCVQFVGTDAALEELLATGLCIEVPPASQLH